MSTPAPSSSPRFAPSTMSSSSANRASNLCSKTSARMYTPKAPTTQPKRCRSGLPPVAWALELPSSVIPKIIPRAIFLNLSARLRMLDPRFLVVRLGALGDIVHTFPAVAGLRETFPNAEIAWLTHPRWKLLVDSSGLASQVWTTETRSFHALRKTIDDLRSARWDASIDYQGLWKSAALPFFGGVQRRIGFSSHTIREFGVPVLYSERVKVVTIHIADQNGELSRRAGARRRVAPIAPRVSPEDEAVVRSQLQSAGIDRYMVLSPGGG